MWQWCIKVQHCLSCKSSYRVRNIKNITFIYSGWSTLKRTCNANSDSDSFHTVHSPNKKINLKVIDLSTSVLLTVRFWRHRFGLERLRVLWLRFWTCLSFTTCHCRCCCRWFGLCCLLFLVCLLDLLLFCFFSKFVICNGMHLFLSNTYWFGIYFYACTCVCKLN